MYILTTLNRIHKITLLFLILTIMSGLIFWLAWRSAHVVGPIRFIEKIQTEQRVALKEIDIESIRNDLVSEIEQQLTEQLSASNIDQPEQSSKLMLPLATDFLNKDQALLSALNQQLKLLPKAETAWQNITTDANQQVYQTANKCLTITRIEGKWLLQNFVDCDRG